MTFHQHKNENMHFATPLDAEQAFYTAFSNADLDHLKNVWLESDDVVCIHPMAARVSGYALVIGSFHGMFQGSGDMLASIDDRVITQSDTLSVHTGWEILHQDASEFRMQVTNAYQNTPNGWKMVLHHASAIQTLARKSRVESQVH